MSHSILKIYIAMRKPCSTIATCLLECAPRKTLACNNRKASDRMAASEGETFLPRGFDGSYLAPPLTTPEAALSVPSDDCAIVSTSVSVASATWCWR